MYALDDTLGEFVSFYDLVNTLVDDVGLLIEAVRDDKFGQDLKLGAREYATDSEESGAANDQIED
jgi:hypothetical protein